jgi:biotin synthase
MDGSKLAKKSLSDGGISRSEALAVLGAGPDALPSLLDAAFTVRRRFWGRGVNLHVLSNAKSGMCRENCAFCSQAIGAYSGVDRYGMMSVDELVAGAHAAHAKEAVKFCMVTATRGPSEDEMSVICDAARRIKKDLSIHLCASLGLLTRDQAHRLKEAGIDRFNHNLESSSRYYPEICQTHTWEDRVQTIRFAKEAGMEACCGGIMGMGETLEDRVELALTLREIEVESIPVNFLDPRPGTPLVNMERIAPVDALLSLCMMRLVNPSRDIRVAGGREVCLRSMQPLALYPANSMFTEGYLTTPGQGEHQDLEMIRDAGFFVRRIDEDGTEPEVVDSVFSV